MLLKKLFENVQVNIPAKFSDVEIDCIKHESADVKHGDAFFCLTKDSDKAEKICEEAAQASVIFCGVSFPHEQDYGNLVRVENVRSLFALACKNFYGRACDDMTMVAVTGTNGKTTTSSIIQHILNFSGKNAGLIGTNGVFFNGKKLDCPLTTPDADFLHSTFQKMRDEKVDCVVMEVSAHAIDQNRVDGILFDYAVLTNITQDHLDYFKDLETYEKTKLGFFNPSHVKKAIVCADDPSACKLLHTDAVPTLSYGISNPSDAFAIDICCSLEGSHFVANICDEVVEVKSNLIGQYNIQNSLAAMLVGHEIGLNVADMAHAICAMMPVEGRFNVVNLEGRFVVVDFAHSPDGLKQVLSTARQLSNNKLFVVFGCGGNRDKSKRHQMGKIAEELADVVCLTDDNPRLEKSLDIIADIEKGMKKEHIVEIDRARAIKKVLEQAKKGDVVVIAGKGAEKYQEIGTQKIEYNDFDVLHEIIKNQYANLAKKTKSNCKKVGKKAN